MKFLFFQEFEEWCESHGLEGRKANFVWDILDDPKLNVEVKLLYHEGIRSGREGIIAHAIVEAFGQWDECLLWIQHWGIWPPGEDWPAFYALRGEDKEIRSIDYLPGHLFQAHESERLTAYMTQVMENMWETRVIPVRSGYPNDIRVLIDHDDIVRIESSRPITLNDACSPFLLPW